MRRLPPVTSSLLALAAATGGVACATDGVVPGPALELRAEGTAIDGSLTRGDVVVAFHASPLPDRDGARVELDIDGAALDVVLDVSGERLTEDAHGSMFAASDRELLLALRDALLAGEPALLETLPGELLIRTADRYAEVPLDNPLLRVDLDLAAARTATIVVGSGCGNDGTTCFPPNSSGDSWALFDADGTCRAEPARFGDERCRGRCGPGCAFYDHDMTWDCLDHDICGDIFSDCTDEFFEAADDWIVTRGAFCSTGILRPDPS